MENEPRLREINPTNLAKAIKRAQSLKPLVRKTSDWTRFEVRSTQPVKEGCSPVFYNVRIIYVDGKFLADCTCQGFSKGRCLHVGAASSMSEIINLFERSI